MNTQKPQIRLSVRLGSLAMLLLATVITVVFSDGKDSRAVSDKAEMVSDTVGTSNAPIVFTNLQAIPSFGK